MKTLLWLDDIRDPKKSNWILIWATDFIDSNIVWVKNYDQFVSWIEKNGLPDKISFDHDLGEELTGYDCAKWLVNWCLDGSRKIPNFGVHSANPVGSVNIKYLLNNAAKYI